MGTRMSLTTLTGFGLGPQKKPVGGAYLSVPPLDDAYSDIGEYVDSGDRGKSDKDVLDMRKCVDSTVHL